MPRPPHPPQVRIIKVTDEGAYVELLEYNNAQAMILAANTTRKRVRNVKKLLRLGTEDYMQVVGVDNKDGKGFVDLSKKTLQLSDCQEKKVEYNKACRANLILRMTAHNLECKLIDLYEAFAWDMLDEFGNLHDAFKLCLNEPELVFSKVEITEEQKAELLKNIQNRMSVAPSKIRTLFSLKCYTYEGIEAIRGRSLLSALQQSEQPVREDHDIVAFETAGNVALFMGDYKLSRNRPRYGDGQWKLFNISTDPGETRDLSADQPERFRLMREHYDAWAEDVGALEVPEGYDARRQLSINSMHDRALRYGPWLLLALVVLVMWRRQRKNAA